MQSLEKESINSIFFGIIEKRFKELRPDFRGMVSFPRVFQKICGSFTITKKECWKLLFVLRDQGLIEIVPYHGIKVLI